MSYARNTIWNKRLPAFSGIFVLLAAVGITLLLSRNTAIFVSKATVGSVPKDVLMSNVSDTTFTVSYTTDELATGVVAYGKDEKFGDVTLDDRDQQGAKPVEHRVHFMTIKNLSPATKYFFAITSGTQTVLNNGVPFDITTAATNSTPPGAQNALKGSAALDDGSIPTEGIVTVSTDTSQSLTALLQPDGTYMLSLTSLRTKDLSAAITLAPNAKLKLSINASTLKSDATLLYSQSGQVPKIVLAKNYDFTSSSDPLATISASDSAKPATPAASFPIFNEPVTVNSPQITTPTESQGFKDTQPLFKGRALPNTPIEITINSQKEISASLQSDGTGAWEFRPPLALDPGKHTVSIKAVDATGILQTITKSFTVYAAGSKFVEPSISPVDVSPSPAASPTFAVTPTASASPTIPITPTPPQIATPSGDTITVLPTRGTLGPTGSSNVVINTIGTVLAISIGALLFFFTVV